MENEKIVKTEKQEQIEQQLNQIAADLYFLKNREQVNGKIVYTNKDMLDILNVNIKTLKKYRDTGYLGYSQIGDKFFYTSNDIALFFSKTHQEAFA